MDKFIEKYRSDLVDSVIPFWMKFSIDKEFGGYFTCLDRVGDVYDTKKYMWLQARQVWMFSKLYNEFESKQEYIDIASLGLNFIRRYGKDEKGRIYFCLTREGKPYFYQRKPYSAVFYMLALLEYYKASGDKECLAESVEMFWKIVEWIKKPELLGRPVLSGQPLMSNLANVMVLACMALELLEAIDDNSAYYEIIAEATREVEKHYDDTYGILRENVLLSSSDDVQVDNWPELRFFNPGHSIETAWFWLKLLKYAPNEKYEKLAMNVIKQSLALGWDDEFGGLYYFMDIQGRPTLQLESSMKLWWPHTESIYALILAYKQTGDSKWIEWLERIDEYAYTHFADPKYGEWFGYCDRRGNLTHNSKGGNYKGCFHVPRFLLMSIKLFDE